jgi:endonuclease/exonuclease/phosphatase family metal-dependent hydrolase
VSRYGSGMIVASFNVENMFRRPKALNTATWADGRPILEKFSAAQLLLEKAAYSVADKTAIVRMLVDFGLAKTDEGPFVILRRSRGQLLSRPQGRVEVTASGRGDWIGWLELKREAVNEVATRNTSRVIGDVNADVLVVIEAEDRPALQLFNNDVFGPMQTEILGKKKAWIYRHTMLIDGNDDRGIDVGLFSKNGFEVDTLRSHVDDLDKKGDRIFSRDCAEYLIRTPGGNEILVLANHFKSKGYGTPKVSNAKRAAQAARTAAIYEERRAGGQKYVIVAGDLNDTPDSTPLKSLVRDTDLADVSTFSGFDNGGRTGTFGTGNDQIDYLLCSPALMKLVTAGGIFRTGVWHGPNVKNAWPMYDTLTKPEEGASDHAAIWANLNLD